MDGQAENRFLGKGGGRAGGSTSSLSAFLGDVPLIAATTVPLGQSVIPSVSRKRDGTAVGEKGYLPLNTLNKMNRKRESTERGEREGEEKARGAERPLLPMSSVASRAPLLARRSRNLLSIQSGDGDAQCLGSPWQQGRRGPNGAGSSAFG